MPRYMREGINIYFTVQTAFESVSLCARDGPRIKPSTRPEVHSRSGLFSFLNGSKGYMMNT